MITPGKPFDVLELVAHAVFVLDRDPATSGVRVCAVNDAAAESLGIEDAPTDRLLEMLPTIADAGRTTFDTGRRQVFEKRTELGGVQRLIRTDLRPSPGPNGDVEWVIGSIADVSDQRFSRQAMVGRSIPDDNEEFIHLAAHDLRAPMKRVTAAADLLRDGFLDLGDGKLELIDLLEEVGKNALELIGDVLAHAEARAAGAPAMPFQFEKMVTAIMKMQDPDGAIDLECDTCEMLADKTVVQCVVRNLIDNAIKHTCPVDGRISLSLRIEEINEQYFRLVFEDNGSDFDPELLFNPPRMLVQDSGFGMLGVRRIVYSQGGTILSGYAKNGSGAHIAVTLPGRRMRAGQAA